MKKLFISVLLFSITLINTNCQFSNSNSSSNDNNVKLQSNNLKTTTDTIRIEAENYTNMSGIQTETCSEGGQNVGYIDSGDWIEYTLNIVDSGTYTLEYRIASDASSGIIDFQIAGQTLKSTIVPNTGGWQNWTTVQTNIDLTAGSHTIRLFATGSFWNINWFDLTYNSTTAPPAEVITIEAESYTNMLGIQTETCAEGGQNVGYIDSGDWLEYTIDVTNAGTFTLEYRVASEASSGAIEFQLDGQALTTTYVPNSGGWQNWTTIQTEVDLTAGTHTVRLLATGSLWNINWFKLTSKSQTPPTVVITVEAESYSNMLGIQTETCAEGGQNVGYIDAGDWLEYSIDIPSAGTYTLEYRVASEASSGAIEFQVNGQALATTLVPNSGGWQNWTTLQTSINLTAGNHTIRLLATGSLWNINWFQLTQTSIDPQDPNTTRIEAEDYSNMLGIQTETCSEGGLNVSQIDNGDWLDYNINIENSSLYNIKFRIASTSISNGLSILLNGESITSLTFSETGGLQDWVTIEKTIYLPHGDHTLRVVGNDNTWNLNWLELTLVDEVFESADKPTLDLKTYNVSNTYKIMEPWNYNKEYNSNRKYPIIITFHNGDATPDTYYVPGLIGSDEQMQNYPAFIYAPNNPIPCWESGGDWIRTLLNDLISTYRIDEDRIYLIGFSMGGSGTYSFAKYLRAEYGYFCAGIVRLAGQSEVELTSEIAEKTSVWYHIGSDDSVDRIDIAEQAYQWILNLPNNSNATETIYNDTLSYTVDSTNYSFPRETKILVKDNIEIMKKSLYTGMGHDQEPPLYDPNVLEWLFNQDLKNR